MFNTQAKNSARQAIISDMTNFAATTIAYYRTPASQGGSGYGSSNWTASDIASYIGVGASGSSLETDNATYNIAVSGTTTVTFSSVPKEGQLDQSGERPRLTLTTSDGSTSITYY